MAPPVRKNISSLSPSELETYRKAVRGIQNNGKFFALACLHGETGNYCAHHIPAFLFWHRLYMIAYEKTLQAIEPTTALHYWDWEQEIIPAAFNEQTCKIDGKEVPNPLFSFTVPDSLNSPLGKTTYRNPNLDLNDLRSGVKTAFASSIFKAFAFGARLGSVENPHDALHLQVGGWMGYVSFSAFDPIFFAHHSNIDRLFASYQENHQTSDIDPTPTNDEFQPYEGPIHAKDVLLYKQFYTYDKLRAPPKKLLPVIKRNDFTANTLALFAAPRAGIEPLGAIHDSDDAEINASHVVTFKWQKKKISGTLKVFLNLPANKKPEEAPELLGGSAYIFARLAHCPNCDEVGEYELDVDISLAYKRLHLTDKPTVSYFFYGNDQLPKDPKDAGFISGPILHTITNSA